jgi:rubrerythrin
MERNQEEYECAHCGYTTDGKFKGDICPECDQTVILIQGYKYQ